MVSSTSPDRAPSRSPGQGPGRCEAPQALGNAQFGLAFADFDFRVEIAMTSPEPAQRRGEAVRAADTLAGRVRDDDEPRRRRGVIVDNRRCYDAPRRRRRGRSFCTHGLAYDEPRAGGSPPQQAPRPAAPVNTMRRRIFLRALATGRPGLSLPRRGLLLRIACCINYTRRDSGASGLAL